MQVSLNYYQSLNEKVKRLNADICDIRNTIAGLTMPSTNQGELVKQGAGWKLADNPTTTLGTQSVILTPAGDAPLNNAIYLPESVIAGSATLAGQNLDMVTVLSSTGANIDNTIQSAIIASRNGEIDMSTFTGGNISAGWDAILASVNVKIVGSPNIGTMASNAMIAVVDGNILAESPHGATQKPVLLSNVVFASNESDISNSAGCSIIASLPNNPVSPPSNVRRNTIDDSLSSAIIAGSGCDVRGATRSIVTGFNNEIWGKPLGGSLKGLRNSIVMGTYHRLDGVEMINSLLMGNGFRCSGNVKIEDSLIISDIIGAHFLNPAIPIHIRDCIITDDTVFVQGNLHNVSDISSGSVKFRGSTAISSINDSAIFASQSSDLIANAATVDMVAIIGSRFVDIEDAQNVVVIGIEGQSGSVHWKPSTNRNKAVYLGNTFITEVTTETDLGNHTLLLRAENANADGHVKNITAQDLFRTTDLSTLPQATDDTTAAAAGVPVGSMYIDPNDNSLKVRMT